MNRTENVNGYLTLSNCAISHQMGFFQNLQLKTMPITHFFPTNYHEKMANWRCFKFKIWKKAHLVWNGANWTTSNSHLRFQCAVNKSSAHSKKLDLQKSRSITIRTCLERNVRVWKTSVIFSFFHHFLFHTL